MYILPHMHVVLLARGFMRTTFHNRSARLRWMVYICSYLVGAANACKVQSLCILYRVVLLVERTIFAIFSAVLVLVLQWISAAVLDAGRYTRLHLYEYH